jgi:hypothetical protein
VPCFGSTLIALSALSASDESGEKVVRNLADVANDVMAMRSPAGRAWTNARAAATAWARGLPFIDCDRSIASTVDVPLARFVAAMPTTACPFSVTTGGVFETRDVTTVARMVGYELASTPRTCTAAAAAAGSARRVSANPAAASRIFVTRRLP